MPAEGKDSLLPDTGAAAPAGRSLSGDVREAET